MTNLILTPVYRAYDKVEELCNAIDTLTQNSCLHILVDDDSNVNEPFPVEASKYRRIILLRRDYSGWIHKNGGGQAMQIGYEWAHHAFIGEHPNPLPYDHIFLIESDVIPLEQGWDQKMMDISKTLPEDWATLDVQSVNEEGKLTHPTTISPRKGFIRADLEHMEYCDFQCSLFNPLIFESGVKFSDIPTHFDIGWSKAITEQTGRQHYRTMNIKVLHYFYQSRQYLNEIPRE
ncbi:MAG: hypothetical protein Q8O72_11315 [Bacteroidales bacterium]|nr:hypothetical protein [Bacteroidales bacterium]